MKEILLNIESKEIRYAYVKFGRLEDLIIERKRSKQITGNIYRGHVINILHNIQSAFININENENGFIHISDIIENTKKFEEMFDMDFDINKNRPTNKKNSKKDISQILKLDQPVLVQVVKEPIGSKGARLTSNISIAGRYLVLLPNTSHRGVSRKIENRAVRDKLKKLIRAFEMPKDMGLICRTASANATMEMLIAEANNLLESWNQIVKKFHNTNKPSCIYEESDIIKKAVITTVGKKYDKIVIDDIETYKKCKNIYKTYEDEHPIKIEYFNHKTPLFEKYNIEKEIEKALARKVWLPSGGYLYFDRTEAMYTIDVNSGKSSAQDVNANVEETLVRINLEAVEEISRQFRLRNIGGLIICDFIDMRFRKNQRRVLEKLKECMKDDWAKCTILGMSEFGLVEMTRQRSRESLIQTMFINCPYCTGRGIIKSQESMSLEMERMIKKLLGSVKKQCFKFVVHPELKKYLDKQDFAYFKKIAKITNNQIELKSNDILHLNEFQIYNAKTGKKIDQ
jgi:ribonuclease G